MEEDLLIEASIEVFELFEALNQCIDTQHSDLCQVLLPHVVYCVRIQNSTVLLRRPPLQKVSK